ncbi:MAG: L-lactate permease [Brevinema sp.]
MLLSILAFFPVLFLIVLLTGFKKPAVVVAPLSLLIAIFLALFIWQQDFHLMVLSGLEGILYGIWPIGVIIFGSICLSNLMKASGSVQKIQDLISVISHDVRIMVVLVAWGLESFLESIAGFGSGLALPISILMAMGVSPFKAGVVALLANSVPTAYGGVGIGVIALSNISGLPLEELMYFLSWQLLIPSLVMPFLIVWVVCGSWRQVREIFWVPLFAGIGQGFGLMFPFGAPVVAVLSGLLNIGGGILATYLFYPHLRNKQTIEFRQVIKPLAPFIIAVVLILGTGPLFPMVNQWVSSLKTEFIIYPGAKPLVIRWIADAGVLLLTAGIVGAWIQGMKSQIIVQTIIDTVAQLQKTMLVLVSILAMSRIMTYSGMIDSLAQGFAQYLGVLYPLFSPWLGTIGVMVTGSVASSGILMGSLQAEMGRILGMSPAWMVAMNASGSTAGKMLAPHSVAIVMAAIGSSDEESKITTMVFKVLLAYGAVLTVISLIAYIIGV